MSFPYTNIILLECLKSVFLSLHLLSKQVQCPPCHRWETEAQRRKALVLAPQKPVPDWGWNSDLPVMFGFSLSIPQLA